MYLIDSNRDMINFSLFKVLMVYLFTFIFTKGNNFRDFLFVSLVDEILRKGDQPFKERICSKRSKFFFLRVDHIVNGVKIETWTRCFL